MDRAYSIVVSRTFVLAFVSNELLPKRIVFIKTDSERSRRLVLIIYDGAQESTPFNKTRETVKKIVRS